MRFFTMDWWAGGHQDQDPVLAYKSHLAAFRDRLPPDLLATEETVSLHDSRLRELYLLVNGRSLRIALDTYAGDARLTLVYNEVTRFESLAAPDVGLGGPTGYGDLGYCEVEVMADGSFEHRLLFSSGIELVVEFRDFRLVKG